MLTVLGAGLPRTGTASLAEALRILGYKTIHHAPERLDWTTVWRTGFRVYDDVDAVCDVPAAHFWREIVAAYDGCKVILTIRSEQQWWNSIRWHAHRIYKGGDYTHIVYTHALHALIFGTPWPCCGLWQQRFRQHNALLRNSLGPEKLLVLNVCDNPMPWRRLCRFLSKPIPDVEFPHKNKREAATSEDGR